MTTLTRELRAALRRGLGRGVSIEPHHTGDLYVSTPYTFTDGDVLPIFIRSTDEGMQLTDHGKTVQRLSYDFQRFPADVWAQVEDTARRSGLRLDHGIATLALDPDPDLRVVQFAQGLTRIAALRALGARTVHAPAKRFVEVFLESVLRWVDEVGLAATANYVDPERDKAGLWPVPLRVEAARPVFVFPLSSPETCLVAASTCLWFEMQRERFFSVGIFHDQEQVSGRARGRAMQVLHRTLPTFAGAHDQFVYTVREIVH